jgi:hypothetical protein
MAFADLVRYQKSQGKGFIGSLSGAIGQATLQKIDPRNYLFNRRGTLATLFPGLKGYQAKTSSDKIASGASGGFSAGQVEMIGTKLDQLSVQMSMTSKNTMSLPMMARDMNVMRQNIVKLVKAQGVKPAQRADAFFMRAGEREKAYESQFGKKTTSPTPVMTPSKTDGNIGLLATLVTTVGNIISTTLTQGLKSISDIITGALTSLAQVISSALQALGVALAGKSILGGVGVPDVGVPDGKKGTPKKGKLSRLGGAAVGAVAFTGLSIGAGYATDYAMDKTGASVDPDELEKLKARDEENFKKMSTSEKIQSGVARGVEKVGGFLGFDRLSERATAERIKSESSYLEKTGRSPTPVTRQDIADLIRQKFKSAGFNDVQAEAAVANAYAESRLDPSARNNNGKEDSVGLFQMNRKGGLGTGYSVEELQDPNKNIDLAIAAAKKSKNFVNATNIQDAVAAFVKDVERPANQPAEIAKRTDIAMNVTGKNLNLGSTALASASRPSGTGTQVVDAKTINNNTQTGSSGGSQVTAYDSDMMRYLLRPVS